MFPCFELTIVAYFEYEMLWMGVLERWLGG